MGVMQIPESDIPGASQARYDWQGCMADVTVKTWVPLMGLWIKEQVGGTWFRMADLEEPHLLKKTVFTELGMIGRILQVLKDKGLLVEHKDEVKILALYGKRTSWE